MGAILWLGDSHTLKNELSADLTLSSDLASKCPKVAWRPHVFLFMVQKFCFSVIPYLIKIVHRIAVFAHFVCVYGLNSGPCWCVVLCSRR